VKILSDYYAFPFADDMIQKDYLGPVFIELTIPMALDTLSHMGHTPFIRECFKCLPLTDDSFV
jgi:hypothetical protein